MKSKLATDLKTLLDDMTQEEFDRQCKKIGTIEIINMKNISTIDVHGKKWFDKVNGNSYFSAQVIINFGKENEKTIHVPFQYGYGNSYLYEAFRQLQMDGILTDDKMNSPTQYCLDNNFILRQSLKEKCTKKEVKEWGSN